MRNIYIIIILSFSLKTFGQVISWCHFRDITIYDTNFLKKLEHIDSISYSYASKGVNVYEPNMFPAVPLTNEMVQDRIKQISISIPRRSARIYYFLSPDIRTLYILGMVQNHIIQTKIDLPFEYYTKWNKLPFGENEFKSEPKFIIPLNYYSSFVSEKEMEEINTYADNALIGNITLAQATLQNDIYRSVYIDSLSQLTAFDEEKIRHLLFEVPVFGRPNTDSAMRLTDSQIKKFTGCDPISVFPGDTLWTDNKINSIQITLKFEITKDFNFDDEFIPAVSKIQWSIDLVGINYAPCNKNELERTFWIKWSDFFTKYNDPIFEQAVNYKLNDYLYRKLTTNK